MGATVQPILMVAMRTASSESNYESTPCGRGFIFVPPGRFEMGGSCEDKYVTAVELPRLTISIESGFSISATPVTEREWSNFRPGYPSTSKPVVNVSLAEIDEYTQWLAIQYPGKRYRLPTEFEWEYACRSGGTSIFPWGNDIGGDDANFYYNEQGHPIGPGERTPVGKYPPNAFGIFDMLGNVCEWTSSAWTTRLGGESGDPSRRVIRGGAWDHLPRLLRSSWRDWAPAEARYDNLGFRLIEEEVER